MDHSYTLFWKHNLTIILSQQLKSYQAGKILTLEVVLLRDDEIKVNIKIHFYFKNEIWASSV